MWLRTGQLANRVQDIALAYRCAVIMPEGGSIWELYHGCYLGYKPNQDINFRYTPTSFSYTPTSLLQEVYMEFIHLLLSNLIGQNVQAMVQIIVISRARGMYGIYCTEARGRLRPRAEGNKCHASRARVI